MIQLSGVTYVTKIDASIHSIRAEKPSLSSIPNGRIPFLVADTRIEQQVRIVNRITRTVGRRSIPAMISKARLAGSRNGFTGPHQRLVDEATGDASGEGSRPGVLFSLSEGDDVE